MRRSDCFEANRVIRVYGIGKLIATSPRSALDVSKRSRPGAMPRPRRSRKIIERFLRNEPIRSRRSSRLEHTWRWCKRKPLVASLIAALILVVAIGLAGALWELRRIQAERVSVRRANLSAQERTALTAEQTKNPAAYDAYLRARAFPGWWHQEGAIRLFQEAVKLDPNFVQAWAYLSIGQSHGLLDKGPIQALRG